MAAKGQVFYFDVFGKREAFEDILAAHPEIASTHLDYDMPRERIDAVLAEAHIYQVQPRSRIAVEKGYGGDRALLSRCPNLLAISLPGSGYDSVRLADCTEAGVLVVNQAGLHAEAVAEHALGMMLCLSKRIIHAHLGLIGERSWTRLDHTGNDLFGKTLGIVGFGKIGRRLAEMCRLAFDMRVVVHHPRRTEDDLRAAGVEPAPFDRLLAESDFVVTALPLTDETRGMFGAAEFRRMKPTAFFVTVARGGVHDETALAAALEDGEIAGAGLDVWEVEPPPPDHPLLSFVNVVATPHNAGRTFDSWDKLPRGAAEQIVKILDGGRPPRLLNPDAWPRYCVRFERIMGHAIQERSTT
ncbi:MAG: hydroxyacid dehydrogenase [Alphaproteobacteria bacterium]|nr:hydroxyacid dehydrogenase [Alphaproteobacteria bacterium]